MVLAGLVIVHAGFAPLTVRVKVWVAELTTFEAVIVNVYVRRSPQPVFPQVSPCRSRCP